MTKREPFTTGRLLAILAWAALAFVALPLVSLTHVHAVSSPLPQLQNSSGEPSPAAPCWSCRLSHSQTSLPSAGWASPVLDALADWIGDPLEPRSEGPAAEFPTRAPPAHA